MRLAPVGFCARGVSSTACAPSASARSRASGSMPAASSATPSARRPSARSALMLPRKPGASTATVSPAARLAPSRRSMASMAPWVRSTSKAAGQSPAYHWLA
ncbi:Uncharacterised protein [Bordetella pertussis]|nr:Uncharacterised protein [Bordetella pertussis]